MEYFFIILLLLRCVMSNVYSVLSMSCGKKDPKAIQMGFEPKTHHLSHIGVKMETNNLHPNAIMSSVKFNVNSFQYPTSKEENVTGMTTVEEKSGISTE